MRKDTRNKLLGLGFDTGLIKKVAEKNLTLTALRGLNKKALLTQKFTVEESEFIITVVKRQPLKSDVVEDLLDKSGKICCYCADGNNSRPFQIHHMEEHHISQNDDEENLMIVCPTHHVVIHKNRISLEEQLSQKKKWIILWSIALNYFKSGLQFPFGAIELIDYNHKGSITEIFSFGSIKPSTCIKLSCGVIADEALQVLNTKNCLILSGRSGSGKTTMAFGVAGRDLNRLKFRYIVAKDSQEACNDILLFLSQAAKELILIIDDANTVIKQAHLEQILNASNIKNKIIIVNTRNDFKGDTNIEQHFNKNVKYIDWKQLQETVKSTLLNNEDEIVGYLKENDLDQFNNHPIGFTEFAIPLSRVLKTYANSAETVWQFTYLLGGGLNRVNEELHELKSNDRFDIIYLFIAIKQISKVENGVSISEIIKLYKINSILNNSAAPERAWIEKQLNSLVQKRILKNERGRYKTIHRQYAKAFIEAFYLEAPGECAKLLDTIFHDSSKVDEIVILWSWLRLTPVNLYISSWYKDRSLNWNELVKSAIKCNLSVVGSLADQMHTISHGTDNKIINTAFKGTAPQIAELINRGEEGTLYFFQELSTTLRYHCSEIFPELMDRINKQKFADLVKETESSDYQYIDILFYAIAEFYPKWIIEWSKLLDFEDFKRVLSRSQKGDVEGVYKVAYFIRRYILDFKRSHLRYCVELIYSLLVDCKLKNMIFPVMPTIGLFELFLFPDDLKKILSAVNPIKLSEELVISSPRHWKKLLGLSVYLKNTDSDVIQKIIDSLDENQLCINIEKYYLESLYEFRVLIYQLGYASDGKKKSIALILRPFIENVYESLSDYSQDQNVLEAYQNLDKTLAGEIAEKFEIILPEKMVDKEKIDFELINEINQYEGSGNDYNLYSTKITLDKKSSES